MSLVVAVVAVGQDEGMGVTSSSSTSIAVQRRLQLGLGAVRAVTLVWAVAVAAIDATSGVLAKAGPAFGILAVLAIWSTVWTVAVFQGDSWVNGPGVAVDSVLAMTVVLLDPIVYAGDRPQSFASAWPLTAVLATGVAAGPTWGLACGCVVGSAGLIGSVAAGEVGGQVLALSGSTVLYGAAGWVGGWVAQQLRTTSEVAAASSARAEVARTLHDGVLQILAVVQRRSDDPELVELARLQDAELRTYLRDGSADFASPDGSSFDAALSTALCQVERRFGLPVRLVIVDSGTANGPSAEALIGATQEAATNSAKHSGADVVWVSVDRGTPSGTEIVIHDEGRGFNTKSTTEGVGLSESVRSRLANIGGSVAINSAPGSGCEVTLWAP